MTDRYPYRHHGPSVHGSKLADYLISEANMIEDIEQLRAENARLQQVLLAIANCPKHSRLDWYEMVEWMCSHARAALSADPAPVATITLYAMPPENAPKGCPVLVAGGIAMRKTGGEWFSGMCEPAFSRRLEWEPKWWAAIPQQNDAIAGENGND